MTLEWQLKKLGASTREWDTYYIKSSWRSKSKTFWKNQSATRATPSFGRAAQSRANGRSNTSWGTSQSVNVELVSLVKLVWCFNHLNEGGSCELFCSVTNHGVSHFMAQNHLCRLSYYSAPGKDIQVLENIGFGKYVQVWAPTASWSSFLQRSSMPVKTKMFPLGRTKAFLVGCGGKH